MGKRVVTYLTDDITGVESDEVESFTVRIPNITDEGVVFYERVSFDALTETQRDFIRALRRGVETTKWLKADPVKVSVVGATSGNSDSENALIREWARKNGWPQLGERGRIPEDAVTAYNADPANAKVDVPDSDNDSDESDTDSTDDDTNES